MKIIKYIIGGILLYPILFIASMLTTALLNPDAAAIDTVGHAILVVSTIQIMLLIAILIKLNEKGYKK
jgi:hypothetical protein